MSISEERLLTDLCSIWFDPTPLHQFARETDP